VKPLHLTESFFFCDNRVLNFDRVWFTNHTQPRWHTQEFATVFWVEPGGTGVLRVDSQRIPLTPGTLVMQRPGDCVQIRAIPGPVELKIARALIRHRSLDHLRQRYLPNTNTFFWKPTARPYHVHLNAAQREWLASWNKVLYDIQFDQMQVDLFLLGLFSQLQPTPSAATAHGPAWLLEAIAAVREPRHFRGGTAAFVRLAGRSREHVNRVLQRCYGQTATVIVNRARMEHAAHELLTTDKKITEICDECGFQNLGHFYRVFEQHYKTTPRRYRHYQLPPTP